MKFTGITIDDASSRDLDDSVWAETVEDGTLLTVCIADVASAIPRGHEHDVVARQKVETRYWSGGNTPMIPRNLAEGDLSLLPGQKRGVLGIQMLLGPDLEMIGLPKVAVGTLKSQAKLAYSSIPGILVDGSNPHHAVLDLLKTTALGLLEKRRLAGALAFYDLNEGWTTTEEGHLLKLERAQANVGYIIIQEMMILANRSLAQYACHHSIPVLFRNHTAKIVAPERQELLRQLEAVRLDPTQIASLRQRVHAVMNRATYDPVILGHYGLSLPFYLHGSSPIRRYADLVTQRQIRAQVLGETLPYTGEEVGAEALHIMTKLAEAEDRRAEAMKEQAERRADRRADQMAAERLAVLKPKDFERVLKVTIRGTGYNPEVAEAVKQKLKAHTLNVLDMFLVLSAGDVWAAERQEVIKYLSKNTHLAMSVCSVGMNVAGWSALEFTEEREGKDHALRFRVMAAVVRGDQKVVSPEVVASPLKKARGMAAVSLLALLSGAAPPKWPEPPKAKEPDEVKVVSVVDTSNPVNSLQEHAQKGKRPFPEYTFERAGGEDHTPLFTCTCAYLGVSQTSPANGNKKDAKKEAARLVLAALGASA